MLIGKLYASSGPLCGPGTGWDSQIVTWPAIDKWEYAKSIDPSVAADASKLIAQYKKYMPNKEDVFIRKVKAYILENIEEVNLNGEMIGKNFNISRMHLYRKLKALTNESASEIVKKIRLQKAMELLQDEDNDFNISEVTYKCGFSSISYFSKTFKDTFGKPPSEVKR